MKPDRFDFTFWGVIALVGVALGAVLLIGDRVGARVVSVTPESGGVVGAHSRIGVEFAQAMNQASVESAFAIEPPVPGKFTWEDRELWFTPREPFRLGVTYIARITTGAISVGGQRVKNDVVWQFTVRELSIIYVAPASDARELWSVALSGGEPKPLTGTGGMIYDFAVSPDGEGIAYTVVNEQTGIDLWLMNRDGSNQRLAVNCAADRCITPNWAPDGSRLAYSRQNAGIAPGAPNGPPRVWTLDIASGQTAAVYQDSQVLGYGPSWSPDGRRIAAFDGSVGGIRVLDLQTGDVMILPSQMGVVGTWAPDGQTMLYNDLSVVGEQPYVKMYLANFQTKEVNLAFEAGEAQIDYSVPVWSPDGQWAAAGLKNALSGGGNQLWIMRPDGSEGRAIADDPKYTYGAYRWDPWSQSLLFQRFELGEPFAKPEIMMWSPGDGVRFIAQDASMPAWLP